MLWTTLSSAMSLSWRAFEGARERLADDLREGDGEALGEGFGDGDVEERLGGIVLSFPWLVVRPRFA